MIVRVDIDIPESEKQCWINIAYMAGFKRENPRLGWTRKEEKEAIRFALQSSVSERLKSYQRERLR